MASWPILRADDIPQLTTVSGRVEVLFGNTKLVAWEIFFSTLGGFLTALVAQGVKSEACTVKLLEEAYQLPRSPHSSP